METTALALVGGAYLAAGLIKGVTGLGFSTIFLALVVSTLGVKQGLPLALLPSVASNLFVMIDAGHFRETVRRYWPMYALTVPGLLIGLLLLARSDGALSAAALGAVFVAYAVFALTQPHWRLPARLEHPLSLASGLLTGLVNGFTGSQLLPVLPFLMSLGLDSARFVQAINVSFTLSSLVLAVGLWRVELFGPAELAVSAIGLVPVFVGVHAGTRLRARLSGEAFRRVVLVLLLVLGAHLVLRSVLA